MATTARRHPGSLSYRRLRKMLADLRPAPGDKVELGGVSQAFEPLPQEAVFCTIGTGAERTTLREQATRNIVQAMDRTGVQRLICQSSLGVGDSRANLGSFTKYVIVDLFLRHAFADHDRVVLLAELEAAAAADLDGQRTRGLRGRLPD